MKSSKERRKFTAWIGPCCPPPVLRPPQLFTSPPHQGQPPRQRQPPHNPRPPHPNHPTPPLSNRGYNTKLLQYNINGISSKLDELLHYMENKKILIAAIQETKLTSKSNHPKTPNYTFVRQDRGVNKGGGLAFLVHKDVSFTLEKTPRTLEQDPHLESMTISITSKDSPLYVRNVYIPPQSSCTSGYVPPLDDLFQDLGESYYIIGDLNAHHELWHSVATPDARGNLLAETIAGNDCGIINDDLPTRVTSTASTAPDISIASSNLIPTTNWTTENKMSSDHQPIIISLTAEFSCSNSRPGTYINFSKANWPEFQSFTENIFMNSREVTNVHQAEKHFRKTLQNASKKFISTGRIPKTYNALPTTAARLIEERDVIQQANPADPRLPDLNKEINSHINEHRKKKWQDHLNTCTAGSKKLWSTIKSLNNQPSQPDNQSLNFNNKCYTDAKDIANQFNKQYTPATNKKPLQALRKTLRTMKKIKNHQPIIFTPEQTLAAIKKAKNSKALGPDDLSPIMLKHLGPHGIKFLTDIYNLCMITSTIPSIWKTAKIIPLLKPGKPSDLGPSYRPVSLLSPAIKILESLLLPAVNEAVKLADHQHGFRKCRSTTTALQSILDHINQGLNQKPPVHRTISVAIDLSRAFDTVDHQILLDDINQLHLNDYIKRFLCAYLRGRQTFVFFRNSKAKYRKVKQGVPQGGVLSPVLFNLYMSKMPLPPGDIMLITYADDSNILNSGPLIKPVVIEINSYLNILDEWFRSRNLFISPAKSSATIFTTSPHDLGVELGVEISGESVPTIKKPKILGVTFDGLLSFNEHSSKLKTSLQDKNKVLKNLAGTSWGKTKEIIVTTYKAIGRSVLNYCCPIWTPNLSNTNWKHLQTAQNTALRVATGCHKMADEDHLHAESKIMKVKPHCEMISKQFLLATQKTNHPNRTDLTRPPPARQMKKTLSSRFGHEISQISHPDMSDSEYKAGLKLIHTSDVQRTLNTSANNKVINVRPPGINDTEKSLPRSTRSTLSQLRSGYSNYLYSYKARCDKTGTIQDKYPYCDSSHTTQHVFNCPNNPTDLTVQDLWTNPKAAARFLDLATDDDNDHG